MIPFLVGGPLKLSQAPVWSVISQGEQLLCVVFTATGQYTWVDLKQTTVAY